MAQANSSHDREEMVVLFVDKTALKAELVTWPEEVPKSETIRKFTVAIGKEKGDKQKQGDNKTPEGIYLTESVIDGKDLPEKYGPFAITLNYPNPFDLVESKTGYGIWLHGVINDDRVEEANVTEGCVAFYNADIEALTTWLRPEQGVVVIANDLKEVNQKSDLELVASATKSWIAAWQQRDIDQYIKHYADDFQNNGQNVTAYKTYKKNVFGSYKKMSVDISKLRIITHPKYAVAMMDQDFNGDDRFKAGGRKILYWRKNQQGQWGIVREIHQNRRFEFNKFNNEQVAAGRRAESLRSSPAQPL